MIFLKRLLRWRAGLAGAILLLALFSCNVTQEDGHTYINVKSDTAWAKFDSLDITWKDSVSGAGGILYQGKLSRLKDINKFPADGYQGQKITVTFKGFNSGALTYEELRGFDGANPGSATKTIVPIEPKKVDSTGPMLPKPKPPKLSSIYGDSLISIFDTASFKDTAAVDTGSLKSLVWIYEENAAPEPAKSLSGKSASINGSHAYAKPGIYTVTLKVISSFDSVATAQFTVRVVQDLPVADAGPDTTVYTKGIVKLHGKAKDGFGKIIKTEWKIGSAAFAVAPAETVFVAPSAAQEMLVYFRVTDDDSQTVKDSMWVHVISDLEANLTALNVSSGRLSPQFDPSVLGYSDTLSNDVTKITIRPQGNGIIKVNNLPVISGELSQPMDLAVGDNTITITVQLDSAMGKTYSLKAHRAAASSNADLTALSLSAGALDSAFSSGDTLYNVSVPNATLSTTVKATLLDTTATLAVNGFKVASGAVSGAISLAVGKNTITIEVTAQSKDKKTYAVVVTRGGSENADLSALSLSAGNINPSFAAGVVDYALSVANSVASTNITVAMANEFATATLTAPGIKSQAMIANKANPVDLVVGANLIAVMVTSQSGATKTYSMQVTRAGDGNSDLSALSISAGAILPAFSADAVFYTLTVPNNVDSTSITATVGIATSKLQINTQGYTSGSAFPIKLVPGPNSVSIVVTAQNGDKKTYTVVVTREKNGNADLSDLAVSSDTLSPHFTKNTTAYSLSVKNDVTGLTLTPKPAASTSTFSLSANGVAIDSSSLSEPIPLRVGVNAIEITVRAENATTKIYTVSVTRAPNANTGLSTLLASAGTPVAVPGNDSTYTLSVANSVISTTVTSTVSTGTSTLTINGAASVSGVASASIPLAVDANAIKIVVMAQSGAKKTYTLAVTRARSANANLSGLAISAGPTTLTAAELLIPLYKMSVANNVLSTTLTPTTSDSNASVTVNALSVISGASSTPIPLKVGKDTILVVVTAQNGDKKTLTVEITRAPNANTDLSDLTAKAGTLNPTFNSTTLTYSDSVGYIDSITTITPTASASTSTLTVNGTAVTSGASSGLLALKVGSNAIPVEVTAQNGDKKTYFLVITRALSANADLSGLTITAGVLNPVFNPATLTYSDTVGYSHSSTTVTPTASVSVSTITVSGSTVISGASSSLLALKFGDNTIPVVVTAQNGDKKTYTLVVTRAAPNANNDLSGLALTAGTLNPAFNSATLTYSDTVGYSHSATTVTPTASASTSTLMVNGVSVTSGIASGTISLNVGNNAIPIQVIAQNGATKTYTIMIKRNAKVVSIAAGYRFTVALREDGTVVAWGDNTYGQTAIPASATGVMAIAAGEHHVIALKGDGTVVAWGDNTYGQTAIPASATGVTAIAAGYQHTVALKGGGTVVAWGDNSFGQTAIPASATGVTAIATGAILTVALKGDSSVMAWGWDFYHQTTIPASATGVTAIASGEYHTVALKGDGTVVVWGDNTYGQTSIPASATGVTAIAAGAYHTLAIKGDGTVVGWGRGDYKQLAIPVGLSGVASVAAGWDHSVALKGDGTVLAWGINYAGETTIPPGVN